jgi:hypothetical protein
MNHKLYTVLPNVHVSAATEADAYRIAGVSCLVVRGTVYQRAQKAEAIEAAVRLGCDVLDEQGARVWRNGFACPVTQRSPMMLDRT